MYKKYIALLCLFFTVIIYCANIGSDFAVTRFNTQVTANNGDRIASFAALNAGFQLANSSAVVQYASFFGVSGTVNLNGGTLNLSKDLILQDVSTLSSTGSTGTINGLTHQLLFSPGTGIINSSFLFSNLQFILTNDLTIQDSQITFTGACVLDGAMGIVALNGITTIVVGANSSLTLKDVSIWNLGSTNIQTVDDTGMIIFDNVRLYLNANYSFAKGSFTVLNRLILDGNGFTFNYQTDLQSTITTNAQLVLQNGVTFNYAPPIASKTLLQLQDATASIMINGATLSTTTTGIQLTNGTLYIDGKSSLTNAGTVVGQAIEFGNGVTANDLAVELLPAAQLQLLQGFLRDRNV